MHVQLLVQEFHLPEQVHHYMIFGQYHMYNNTRKFQRKPYQEIQDKFFLWVQDMFLILDNIGIYIYICIDADFYLILELLLASSTKGYCGSTLNG